MGGISGEGTAYSASDHPHTMGGISGEGTAYSASDHEITSIRWVVLVEKELLTLPMIMRSPPCLVGFVLRNGLTSVYCFVDNYLSLCSFYFWYPSNYSFRLHCAIFKRLFNACSLEICKFQYHTVKWGELDIIKFVSNKNVDICNL